MLYPMVKTRRSSRRDRLLWHILATLTPRDFMLRLSRLAVAWGDMVSELLPRRPCRFRILHLPIRDGGPVEGLGLFGAAPRKGRALLVFLLYGRKARSQLRHHLRRTRI